MAEVNGVVVKRQLMALIEELVKEEGDPELLFRKYKKRFPKESREVLRDMYEYDAIYGMQMRARTRLTRSETERVRSDSEISEADRWENRPKDPKVSMKVREKVMRTDSEVSMEFSFRVKFRNKTLGEATYPELFAEASRMKSEGKGVLRRGRALEELGKALEKASKKNEAATLRSLLPEKKIEGIYIGALEDCVN